MFYETKESAWNIFSKLLISNLCGLDLLYYNILGLDIEFVWIGPVIL